MMLTLQRRNRLIIKIKDLEKKEKLFKKDVDLIKNIGLKSYMENTALQQANKGYYSISKLEMSDQANLKLFKTTLLLSN
jgi:hypothetical protein